MQRGERWLLINKQAVDAAKQTEKRHMIFFFLNCSLSIMIKNKKIPFLKFFKFAVCLTKKIFLPMRSCKRIKVFDSAVAITRHCPRKDGWHPMSFSISHSFYSIIPFLRAF